jgi:hypothetical protein
MSGENHTAFHRKNHKPRVKLGGGSVMVWGCFGVSWPGWLALIEGTMNSPRYQRILQENVWPSVCELKHSWVMQQDNDPKHTVKSTWKWLKSIQFELLEWPSQSPDLIPNEMLWQDLKRAVHAEKSTNVAQLKQFCMPDWANISPQRCERLINKYR